MKGVMADHHLERILFSAIHSVIYTGSKKWNEVHYKNNNFQRK